MQIMKLPLMRILSLLALTLLSLSAFADARLTHFSGQVQIKQSNGEIVVASPESIAKTGDTILTGSSGYVRVETSDGGEIVLRPNSEFVIEKYNYDANKPEDDSFVYKMLKGGMRTVTGLIGKRGNKNAYRGNTRTATIGIRGTQFDVRVCADDCGALANGTYFFLRSGSIATGNSAGDITMSAGQIAFVGLNQAPVILPRDPGIGFTPPANIPVTAKDTTPAGAEGDGQNCSIE